MDFLHFGQQIGFLLSSLPSRLVESALQSSQKGFMLSLLHSLHRSGDSIWFLHSQTAKEQLGMGLVGLLHSSHFGVLSDEGCSTFISGDRLLNTSMPCFVLDWGLLRGIRATGSSGGTNIFSSCRIWEYVGASFEAEDGFYGFYFCLF